MINIKEDETNSIRYIISMNARDGEDILLGTFVKSCDDNKNYNNVLTLYTDANFKINTQILCYIADTIQERFGDLDFAIMTSDIFKTWKDESRYITKNIL